MNTFSHVPPGFRFHPTDEELVDYYLRRKINCRRIDLDVIKDVDLYKIEPWDLQELCRIGTDEQNEWYFFSHKDKKYPTGTRTNRATTAGFWKATGRDKAIYSKHDLVGMRKTLVFYRGRAPNGQKSDWIMHEYRLETDENGAPQEEGWVVCRVFKKRLPTMRKVSDHDSLTWYDDQVSFIPDHHLDSPNNHHHHHHQHHPNNLLMYHQNPNPNSYPCKKELDLHFPNPIQHAHYTQLPFLENPKILQTPPPTATMPPVSFGLDMNQVSSPFGVAADSNQSFNLATYQTSGEEQVTDWRVLDKFVASQLSHEGVPKQTEFSSDNNDDVPVAVAAEAADMFQELEKQELPPENASTSTSSCPMDLWK